MADSKDTDSKDTVDFEGSLKSLESIASQLEMGELSLDASLKAYEQGIHLIRQCEQALSKAEKQVQKLVEKDGEKDGGKDGNPETIPLDQPLSGDSDE